MDRQALDIGNASQAGTFVSVAGWVVENNTG